MVVETHGGDVRCTVAVLVAVGARGHAVVVVKASEEVELLLVPQLPQTGEDIVPGLHAAGQGCAAYVRVVEGIAVLVLVVSGVCLVVLRDAVGIT